MLGVNYSERLFARILCYNHQILCLCLMAGTTLAKKTKKYNFISGK